MKKRAVADVSEKKPEETVRKRRKPLFDKLLIVAIVLLLAAAAVLFAWEPIQTYFRDEKTSEIMDGIKTGEATIVVNRNDLVVNGEEDEIFDEYESFPTVPPVSGVVTIAPTPTEVPEEENVVLTSLGTITIDKIDLLLPLLDSAEKVPLRYGAGMLEGTAMPGTEGNCVILGHRMKTHGRLFNRLNEVAVGDSIVLTMLDGAAYTYTVDNVIPELDPAELPNYIGIYSGTGKQLTLITCTPVGVGSHRIIIIAHMA
jgi:sortase A